MTSGTHHHRGAFFIDIGEPEEKTAQNIFRDGPEIGAAVLNVYVLPETERLTGFRVSGQNRGLEEMDVLRLQGLFLRPLQRRDAE